jgi:hypothetical protein
MFTSVERDYKRLFTITHPWSRETPRLGFAVHNIASLKPPSQTGRLAVDCWHKRLTIRDIRLLFLL